MAGDSSTTSPEPSAPTLDDDAGEVAGPDSAEDLDLWEVWSLLGDVGGR